MSVVEKIRIGTRGSELALWQANRVEALIAEKHPQIKTEILPIQTEGDLSHQPLSELGGKGVFIKAIQQALLDQTIDVAVHSFKDITSAQPDSLKLAAFLTPESQSDCLVSNQLELPKGARIGTGSLRRARFLLESQPDLCIVPIRGNVPTRIQMVETGEVDAVMLSEAGVIRLGFEHRITKRYDCATFLPAPGQGVIALECRKTESELAGILRSVGSEMQYTISQAEHYFLEALSFDCNIPLGFWTRYEGEHLLVSGKIACKTGSFYEKTIQVSPTQYHGSLKSLALEFRDAYEGNC